MADKGKGVKISVAGHKIDKVGEKLGTAVDKVAGDKLGKVDVEKLGKQLDKFGKNIDIDLGGKKKK